MHKFVPRSRVGIFRNEHTDTPHWTLNLRFDAFHTIWVHSGPFGCLTKLGAKWAELVQKFVPRSRIGFFHKGCTRSTPLDPKLTFWCVSYYLEFIRDHLVALRNSVQNGPNKCKSSCHQVASEFFAMNAPNPPHLAQN